MGKPDKIEEFHELLILEEPEIKVYVDDIVLNEYVKNSTILVVLEGYGRYNIEIQD